MTASNIAPWTLDKNINCLQKIIYDDVYNVTKGCILSTSDKCFLWELFYKHLTWRKPSVKYWDFIVPFRLIVNAMGRYQLCSNTQSDCCISENLFWFVKQLTHLPPSAAYMHRWTGSALVQVMACHLIGTKPSPEPMLTLCQLDP